MTIRMTTGRAFCLHLLAKKAKEPAQKGSRFDVFWVASLWLIALAGAGPTSSKKRNTRTIWKPASRGTKTSLVNTEKLTQIISTHAANDGQVNSEGRIESQETEKGADFVFRW